MTEPRQTLLFALSFLTLVCAAGALAVGCKTFDQYRTDNQTIAVLRAQVTELKRDLHDTEVALDKEALAGLHLTDENEVLQYELDTAKRGIHL